MGKGNGKGKIEGSVTEVTGQLTRKWRWRRSELTVLYLDGYRVHLQLPQLARFLNPLKSTVQDLWRFALRPSDFHPRHPTIPFPFRCLRTRLAADSHHRSHSPANHGGHPSEEQVWAVRPFSSFLPFFFVLSLLIFFLFLFFSPALRLSFPRDLFGTRRDTICACTTPRRMV